MGVGFERKEQPRTVEIYFTQSYQTSKTRPVIFEQCGVISKIQVPKTCFKKLFSDKKDGGRTGCRALSGGR